MSNGIDIIALGRKSLISIFERKKDEKTSIQEVEEINRFIDDNISKESNKEERKENDNYGLECLLDQDKIEYGTNNIRMVVVTYMSAYQNPFPYIIKREIPLLKKAHTKVLEIYRSKLYQSIVEHAYDNIFAGDLRLLEPIEESKSFFLKYTDSPLSLDLQQIKKRIHSEYLSDIPTDFFIL